jgi:hypothetical protein
MWRDRGEVHLPTPEFVERYMYRCRSFISEKRGRGWGVILLDQAERRTWFLFEASRTKE